MTEHTLHMADGTKITVEADDIVDWLNEKMGTTGMNMVRLENGMLINLNQIVRIDEGDSDD